MSRLKRRILIATALLVLVLIGLAALLYVPTRHALQRAETLQFRRMAVAKVGEEGVYRFFYVTNRNLEPGEEALEKRFGSDREESVKFGHFDTDIEPTLGIGMIINPTDWFQNEQLNVRGVVELEQTTFVGQVRELVQASPHRALLVVIHGFRETFPGALRKTAFVGHVLDINAPVLVFDWPGNQGSTLRGYRRASQIAEASGAELAGTLELIIRDIEPTSIWVLANSMGAQVVADAFSVLYENTDLADMEKEIENVVLTAPDVSHDEFDDRFKQEINALTRRLTVYVSSNDRALLMSRLINRDRRRGESTLDISNPDQLDVAAGVSELIDPDGELITLVDVTPVNRTRNFHNFSLETPEFFDDLFLRLTNADTPRSRLLYNVRLPNDSVYWVLTSSQ